MLARSRLGGLPRRFTRPATHASGKSVEALNNFSIPTPYTDSIANSLELPPKSALPATFHAITHGHPAALLHLRSHHLSLLNLFVHFSACAADALAIPISQPVMLPRERRLWTVPRSPFVHKKSQENFERVVHKRVIKAWDANPQLIGLWEEYLKLHSLAGVGMRIVKWEHLPLEVVNSSHKEELKVIETNRRKVTTLGKQIMKQVVEKSSIKSQESIRQRKKPGSKQLKDNTNASNHTHKMTAVEILNGKPQATGRKVRITNAQRKRLERRARWEEAQRIAREKLAQLPNRVGETMIELNDTVKRALKAVPRYDTKRPTISVARDLGKIWSRRLLELEGREREEKMRELTRSEEMRADLEGPLTIEETARVKLFANPLTAPKETLDSPPQTFVIPSLPVHGVTTDREIKSESIAQKEDDPATSVCIKPLVQLREDNPRVTSKEQNTRDTALAKPKYSAAWNNLLAATAQTKPRSK